jgi:uncharacterized protein
MSTLVSAALRENSIPYSALMKALASGVLCASVETLGELDVVLEREKFERYLPLNLRQEFAASIRRNVQIFETETPDGLDVEPLCRDAKDKKFLTLAIAAETDVIVSSDIHLLELNPWRGIPILKPAAYLEAQQPGE